MPKTWFRGTHPCNSRMSFGLRTSLHRGNGLAAKNRSVMIQTSLATRLHSQGAEQPGSAVVRESTHQAAATSADSVKFQPRGAKLVALGAGVLKDVSTPMLSLAIARIVEFCTRHIWPIILAGAVLAVACGGYAARHFNINADVGQLISSDLPWRQRELAYEGVFTHGTELIVAVVDAPTPELATAASKALVDRLTPDTKLFNAVESVGTNDFFVRNRLLFLPTEEVAGITGRLSQAGPLLSQLTTDPSLRGLVQAMSLTLTGVEGGQVPLDALARPLNMSADAIEKVLAGEPAWFSWYVLMSGQPAGPSCGGSSPSSRCSTSTRCSPANTRPTGCARRSPTSTLRAVSARRC